MKRDKKVGLVQVLEEVRLGLSPSKISKKYKIPKQNIAYIVGKLKSAGCIKKKGYGVWEYLRPLKEVKDLAIRQVSNPNFDFFHKKEIRGHAFVWKIEFYDPQNWEKAIKNYQKSKLNFQLMKHNKQFRTIFKNRKIWLGKKGLTIYEAMDFRGRSSFEVKGNAVFEMDLLIKDLLSELDLKFRPYRFTTSREHYGIMKNELARQYNEKKEKMEIRSSDGDIWMWIDDSKSLGELENKDPVINRQVQNYWNNHKQHNFEVNASFILNGFNKTNEMIMQNASNLNYHAENMRSHVDAVQKLGNAVEELTEQVKKLKNA